MRDPDHMMLLAVVAMFLIGAVAAVVIHLSDQREARAWEQFQAEHCRITGSYDKEGGLASRRHDEFELKVYHCDDGSIHVR